MADRACPCLVRILSSFLFVSGAHNRDRYKTQTVPQPDAKGKAKGKAKAPEEPSAKGGRKRANSTEIQPDVGGSKKRRVASQEAADFPMYVYSFSIF